MRVVVVGAGVLGVSLAYHLARGGAEVTLVEGEKVGGGTSSRGAGLATEGLWHPTSIALVQRSVAALRRLGEGDEGSPFRWHAVGSTTLVPPRQAAAAHRMADLQRRHGAEVQVLSPSEAVLLPRHEGLRLDDVGVALHYPRDGWALPRLYCEARAYEAEVLGATILAKPARLVRAGEGVTVLAGDRPLEADAVVLAAGIWTRRLLLEAGLDAPLVAYRTQAMRFVHPRGHELPILHDLVQGFYLRPHWPGQLLVGNGTTTRPEDPERWAREADDAFRDSSARRLGHRLPGLAEARPGEAWAGLDAATPDRLMLAGPHPEARGLWLLAGGNGHGFMRAPAAGESLAARILGRAPPVDLSAFDPSRLADRWREPFEAREGFTLEA